MSQYNKLSDIQYARIHILPVDLHFETVLVSYYPHRTQRKGESIHFGANHFNCCWWMSVQIPFDGKPPQEDRSQLGRRPIFYETET